MPTTAYSAIPTPAASAAYNLPADIQAIASQIDTRLVIRVATLAARNALASPPDGTLVVLTASPGAVWLRSGGAWVTVWDGAAVSSLSFASIYRTVNQTATTSGVKVSFDAVTEISSDITHSAGRLTVSATGVYTVTCAVRIASDYTGAGVAAIRKNASGSYTGGVQVTAIRWSHVPNWSSLGVTMAKTVRLTAGDHLEAFALASTASEVIGGESVTYLTMVGNR